jgi:hypothetical protein
VDSAACSDGNGNGDGAVLASSLQADEATLRAMYKDVLDYVADRSCAESRLCGHAAAGAKPCGGPTQYIVYSKTEVEWGVLHEKLNALREFETAFNYKHDRISDCSTPREPVPGCVDGSCVDTAK